MSAPNPCFKAVAPLLDNLLTYIEVGDIGLPVIVALCVEQRPGACN